MKTLTLTHVCGKTVVNAVYPKVFEFVKLWNCHCDPAGCGGGNLPDIYKGLLKRQIASVATLLRNDDEKAVIASGVQRSEAICRLGKQKPNI